MFWHTANESGGTRTAVQGSRLRAEGLQAGIPDLFLVQRDPMASRSPVPAGCEALARSLRVLLGELREALPLTTYLALLRSVGLAPTMGLELKSMSPSASLSEDGNQEKWARDLSYAGIQTFVCHGADNAKAAIRGVFGD